MASASPEKSGLRPDKSGPSLSGMRDSLDRIKRAVTDGPIKKNRLAEEAQLSPDVLKGIERDDWNPRSSTVEALCDALDRIAARLAA